jgi:putative transposase
MPRYARLPSDGQLIHFITRFANREYRMCNDRIRRDYLTRVNAIAARLDFRLLAYALMSTHIHWLYLGGQASCADFAKPLHTGFALWLNRREGRLGPVMSERPSTIGFDPSCAPRLLAYLHNNPVRAGVVRNARDSSWTSHRYYLGLDEPPAWLDVKLGLGLCGLSPGDAGRMAFEEHVLSKRADGRQPDLSARNLPRVRTDVRASVGPAVEVTSPRMSRDDVTQVGIVAPAAARLRPRWKGDLARVLEAVAQRTGISPKRLTSRERPLEVVAARRVALSCVVRSLHRPLQEGAALLAMSSGSASRLLKTVTHDQLAAGESIAAAIAAQG